MNKLHCIAMCLVALGGPIQAQIVMSNQDFTHAMVHSDGPQPRWSTMYSQHATWVGGNYQWWFNPANLPANLVEAEVVEAMQTAALRWMQMCNVNIQYMGKTNTEADTKVDFLPDRVNVWGSSYAYDIAGFSPMTYAGTGEIVDSDILLGADKAWDLEQLKSIMTHEIGHGLGLGHSNLTESVMFATPYHDFDYTNILRGDDASGCAAMYGEAPQAQANRTMNWAEVTYPEAFQSDIAPTDYSATMKATPAETSTVNGVTFRHYAVSNSYLGTKDGVVHYVGPDGVMQTVGSLDDFSAAVAAGGF